MKNSFRDLICLLVLLVLSPTAQAQQPPVLIATGDKIYCPGTAMPVVSSMSITDPDSSGAMAVYIQISSGYTVGQDILQLSGTHPNVTANWDVQAGKLTLSSPSNAVVAYTDFVAAIESVLYINSAQVPSGTRTFSISIGEANYLPSTGHYYQFVPALGITWTNARVLASQSTYYGLQGYLATLGAADEAKLSGEQASGAGWIGGTDEETEGVWKWVTGPEAGTIFWNGQVNGSTPNFAFWNNSEPNNLGEEDYAHITAPGVGIPGSWNDLTNQGGDSGDYQPKGYIVEYGGMPNDPVLYISTSTKVTMPKMLSVAGATNCGPGTLTLSATADFGTVKWYDTAAGGNLVYTGSSFTTPLLTATTTYYVNSYESSCTSGPRTPVTATIVDIPVITVTTPAPSCDGIVTLEAATTSGQIRWFSDATADDSLLATGPTYTTSGITQTTTYYVDALHDGCMPDVRTPVTVTVLPKPSAPDEQLILCEGDTAVLDAGIPNAGYLWSGTNAVTRTIIIDQPGTYQVLITNPEGCSTTKTFTVIGKMAPVIKNVLVKDTEVTINMENTGEFLYSVDGVNFQESNVFTVEIPGINKAYVHQINDCGDASTEFLVIIAPGFFTPNGDNHNDVWTAHGMNFLPDPYIAIFDRFGKLIAELHKGNMSWNGTYGGLHLPAADYWYIFRTSATATEARGHFSLVR